MIAQKNMTKLKQLGQFQCVTPAFDHDISAPI